VEVPPGPISCTENGDPDAGTAAAILAAAGQPQNGPVGTGPALSRTVVASSGNVNAVSTFGTCRDEFAFGSVDGRHAGTVKDLRIVMGSGWIATTATSHPRGGRRRRVTRIRLSGRLSGLLETALSAGPRTDKSDGLATDNRTVSQQAIGR